MQLHPPEVDPNRLFRPGTVARRFGVNASMVTHWMTRGELDYISIDGQKLIPEESIAELERSRALAGRTRFADTEATAEHARHVALGENHWMSCGLCDETVNEDLPEIDEPDIPSGGPD